MRQARQDPHLQSVRPGGAGERVLGDAAGHHRVRDELGAADRWLGFGSESGVELQYPSRLAWPSPWVGHIPFAFWLVDAVRPRVVVELGVHTGNSYCAFLQAVQSLSVPARCFGIDHWLGDEHSDRYGEDVYAELRAYHDAQYGAFSTLIRSTFAEALPYFADDSVDVLHIDGFHTYDAVSADFSDWLPKMSSCGVVLFHDINVRERDFGVWRFWDEIAARYETFSFVHSHGLGVAYVGSEPATGPLRALLTASDAASVGRVRSYFARLGTSLVDRFERRRNEDAAARAQSSDATVESLRAEHLRLLETAEGLRADLERATARVLVMQDELTATRDDAARRIQSAASTEEELAAVRQERSALQQERSALQQRLSAVQQELSATQQQLAAARAESARQSDAAAVLQQELSAVRQELSALRQELTAAQAESSRQSEAAAALRQQQTVFRAEAARGLDAAALLQRQLSATRAESSRHAETAAALQQELAAARADTGRQSEALTAVERELAVARREADQHEAAAQRVVCLEAELRLARAEVTEQRDSLERARVSAEATTAQAEELHAELSRARGQLSEALDQRDRATLLLRQQIATSAALQRQLSAGPQSSS